MGKKPDLTQFNVGWHNSPEYQKFMTDRGLPTTGDVKLSKNQRKDLQAVLESTGYQIPKGMKVSQSGSVTAEQGFAGQPAWLKGLEIGGAVAGSAFIPGVGPVVQHGLRAAGKYALAHKAATAGLGLSALNAFRRNRRQPSPPAVETTQPPPAVEAPPPPVGQPPPGSSTTTTPPPGAATERQYAGDAYGNLMAPWTEKFSYPEFTGKMAETPTPQPWEAPQFTETYQAPEWKDQFKAPTMEEVAAEPGYQFRAQEGQKAIERAAASGGTLLTGGTLKDLSNYGQNLASQEYGNVYGRRAGEYKQRYGEFEGGAQRGLQGYATRQNAFENAANRNLQAYTTGRDVNEEQYRRATDTYNRERANWEMGRSAKLQEYQQAHDIFEQTQEKQFGRLYKLAELGRF